MFNSIAHEWDVELNTRREIPYLKATMYYFVYHINTIALYWEEKPNSWNNENKWIDNFRITIILRWKNALNHDNTNNNGRHFQFTKFSFIDFVLTDRGSLSGKRPILASEKSSSCRFSFSAERTANIKAAEYVIQWISQQPLKSSEFSVSRHIYRKANPPHHRSLPFSVSGQHWNQSLAPFF